MTLKELCKALGWKRIRRWDFFAKEVKAIESNLETQRFLREKAEARTSISPYFDSLFGDWQPDPNLVKTVMGSIETRPIEEVFEAVIRSPIAYSRYQGAQGWIAVDRTVRLTTLACANKIVKDTPVDTLRWIAERQDCDDISEIFESICRLFYGVNVRRVLSFSSRHAFIAWPLLVNGVSEAHPRDDRDRVTSRVEWRFLEPQTDGWKTDLHIGDGTGTPGDVSEALIV